MKRAIIFLIGISCLAPAYAQQPDSKVQALLNGAPLSFEPNVGQNPAATVFSARGAGYELELKSAGARFQFAGNDSGVSRTVTMNLAGATGKPAIRGEEQLPGRISYSRTPDPKTWFKDIPTYARVHYTAVYRGVDMAWYGAGNRVEYDFIVSPGGDTGQIRMEMGGADRITLNAAGELVFALGKGDFRLLKPLAYQTSADGKRETVAAAYRLDPAADGRSASVSFSLGAYDRSRAVVIDPVASVPALAFSEYTSASYLAGVAVDSAGNAYVTGYNTASPNGFYVTKYNASGAVVYTHVVGTGPLYPARIAVDSSFNVDVAGQTQNTSVTLPTGANSYKTSFTASNAVFYAQLNSAGSTVNYASYLAGTDTSGSAAQGMGVDASGNAYLAGYTYSGTFPVTTGAYQTAFPGTAGSNYSGWVAKFNPAASGAASLVYSTFLGSANSQLFALAVDSSNNTYVTGNATTSAYPVTTGAFRYSGYDSASGGVYVTKLNSTGTALAYSAYLGYGSGYGIAVDGQTTPNAYITGDVSYADFPTTAGAYQTTYAGGFAVKLSSDGSSEVYSTFLGGPSSFTGGTAVNPNSISLPLGCASSCNAYIAGWTRTTDFPLINPFDATPAGASSGFLVELAANGGSAVFSSYFSGITDGVYEGFPNGTFLYGFTPAVAVDSAGNMTLAGNTANADFPNTIANGNYPYTYLARVVPSSSPFLLASVNYPNQVPPTVNFTTSQPVGVSTSLNGSSQTVNVRNLSGTAATIATVVSPPNIFSESDSCGGAIAAGAVCAMTLNFTPGQPGPRTGTVTVTSNAGNSPLVITVNGGGVDEPYLQPSVSSLAFGSQTVNIPGSPQSVTITNLGDETAALNIYLSTGTDYSLLKTCPTQLAPNASCTVSVVFSPTQPGPRLDTINITNAGPYQSVSLIGTGVVSGASDTVTINDSSLNFGNETVGISTGTLQVTLQNTGSYPMSFQSVVASGDFAISSNSCPVNTTTEFQAQQTCSVNVTFTPTVTGTRNGLLSFSDSASGSPQTVSLTGVGLASTQTVEFYPGTTVVFADQAVGFTSSSSTIYAENTGTAPITFDRVLVTGPFQITYTYCPTDTVNGTVNDGVSNTYSYCYANVAFAPTTTGFATGTLVFVDSAAGSPQTVNLQGNGIAATGTLQLLQTQLDFATEPVGVSTPTQLVELYNPGNAPITVTGYSAGGSTDFAVTNYNCGGLPFALNPSGGCYVQVSFTPSSTSNPRTATLTVTSSAGNQTVALSGNGVTASEALGITPSSPMNSGTIVVGQTSGTNGSIDGNTGDLVSIRNTGTSAITFSVNPSIGGTNLGDFALYNPNSCGITTNKLQPGASCVMWVRFTPLATGSRTATLSFTDDAPGSPQQLTLNGTGAAAAPTYGLTNFVVSFDNQAKGTTSPINTFVRFLNNSASTVTMGNPQITGDFLIPSGENQCNGTAVSAGSSCYVYLSFAPTASGNRTGTITFVNSTNTSLVSAPLDGFSPTPADTALLTPSSLDFGTDQVVGTASGSLLLQLTNSGNGPLKIGVLTGTNLGGTPTNEFTITSDGCSNQTIGVGALCNVYIVFTPNAAGTRTGTVNYPLTYSDGTTGSLPATLTGLAVVEVNHAVLSPSVGSFVDQTVGVTSNYNVTVYLQNSGNRPFTVGALTGVNTVVGSTITGEFSTSGTQGGSDGCSHQTVQIGSTCTINVRFTPTAAGAQTGTVTFPVTFADNSTTSPVVTFTGNGVASGLQVEIVPGGLNFNVQVVGTTSPQQYVQVRNIGNAPVAFNVDSITGQFASGPNGDGCNNLASLAVGSSCYIYVVFSPTSAGVQTGTLTIADNAAGGPHTVSLTGTEIATTQQVAVSTPSIAFGQQPAGSNSAPELIYVTNQGNTTISGLGAVLGGTTSAFSMTNNCPASLGALSTCSISVAFTPGSGVSGAQAAMVTISYTGSGSPVTVLLAGTAIAPAPVVTLYPNPMTFPIQNVGTTSTVQRFAVTNTGSANLTISTVVSGNPTEFAIVSDGCSGSTLTPNQVCSAGVTFSPILGGTRSSNISVTDNATGSPQILTVTGSGFGIPKASLSPASFAFGSANLGTTTATHTFTLTNGGTDTLNIASVGMTAGNTADFITPGNNCGTTLAPGANCSIVAKFSPTAAGARGASLTVTDNANNSAGSTQSVALTGTGVAVPTATVTGGPLAFGNQNLDTTGAPQSVTLTNSGTGPLTIASIAVAAPFAETDNCGASLPNGSNCKITILFTPTVAGAQNGTITITDNAGNVAGTQQNVAVSGTGVGVPTGTTTTPTSLTFGDQNIGTTSAAQTVTFNNAGTGPLTIASIAITQSSTDFAISNNPCGSTLAAGANCQISITFKPTAIGGRAGALVFTDNAGNVTGSAQAVTLTGTGVGVPQASPSPGSLTFTSQNVGTASASQNVVLTNGGTGPLTISSISIGGTNPTDYLISSTTCGASLATGGNCSVSVTFDPAAAGSRTATLLISDNAANTASTQSIGLSGTGVGIPTAVVSPTNLPFPNTSDTAGSGTALVTIGNTGTGALTLTGITGLTGTAFTEVNNCGTLPATIQPGGSCVVGIRFRPAAPGPFSATLTITDNTGNVTGSTQTVTMSGTGYPTAALSPNLTFAAQTVGTTSAAQVVTLSNSGVDALTITAISGVSGAVFGGADPLDFLTNTPTGSAACSTSRTLAAGKSCTISVKFKPSATGARTATLIVTDNSGNVAGTQQSVTLTGTGQ